MTTDGSTELTTLHRLFAARTLSQRAALFLAACLALCAALSGCTSRRDGNSQVATIRVADWGGASADENSNRINKEILDEFHRLHPHIRVQMEHMPDAYTQKILMSVLAKTQPDVMAVDASYAAIFINNGILEDLMPYIEADPDMDLSVFYPNVLNIARRDGKLYALPGNFTPMMMYYNKAAFRRAGVPYPKDGWTWDDFLTTAKALTIRKNGRVVQYGAESTNWMPGWITWIWQNGGDVLSPDGTQATGYLNGPRAVEAMQFYTDLVLMHKVAPSTSEKQALGSENFLAGRTAMTDSGHWMIPHFIATEGSIPGYKFSEIGVVHQPLRAKRVTVMYESGPGLMKGSKHPQEAYEYIKFITGPWAQRKVAEQGLGISANRHVAEEFRDRSPLEPVFLDEIKNARGPWGAHVEQYALVEDIGREAVDEILLGKSDVKTALTEAARRIDIQLAGG